MNKRLLAFVLAFISICPSFASAKVAVDFSRATSVPKADQDEITRDVRMIAQLFADKEFLGKDTFDFDNAKSVYTVRICSTQNEGEVFFVGRHGGGTLWVGRKTVCSKDIVDPVFNVFCTAYEIEHANRLTRDGKMTKAQKALYFSPGNVQARMRSYGEVGGILIALYRMRDLAKESQLSGK